MSNTRDGGNPPGESPARKRRRKRRPKRNGAAQAPVRDLAAGGAKDPGQGNGQQSVGQQPAQAAGEAARAAASRSRRRGKRRKPAAKPGATPAPSHLAIAEQTAGGGKRKKRRRPAPDAQRHVRAPVRPQPDARFEPVEPREQPARPAENVPARRPHAGRTVFAALDLGTNNCRLLVAAPEGPGRFRVVDAFSRIVRLGEGLGSTGRLREEAMRRALDALAICAGKLAGHRVAAQRLIATEACRQAENGAEFLERVRESTGLELEVVDRETEARLAAEGCGSLMDRQARGAVLFDIGGGSTELVLVRRSGPSGPRISGNIAGWTSLPVGVVTLSERHGGGREVTGESFAAMVDEVSFMLERFEHRHHLADIWDRQHTHLLGTSGTVTTIAGLHLKLPRYDRRKVDGIWLSEGEVDAVIAELLAMDYDARAGNACIGRERADLVLAGCAILEAIRRTWPSPRLRVADRGLREGILNELMLDAGVWDRQSRNPGSGRRQEEKA